jgi:hypothetical protein
MVSGTIPLVAPCLRVSHLQCFNGKGLTKHSIIDSD